MIGTTVLSTVLTTVTFLHCASFVSTALPSQYEYLSELLNMTVEGVKLVSYQFEFNTNASAKDLSIIQRFPNGTNISFALSDLLSGSSTVDLVNNRSVVIMIHGYTNSGNSSWINNMANAYDEDETSNIFAVDWSFPAKQNYLVSARLTKNVGELVGEWLVNLQTNGTFNFSDVHLIGHSLGAHICGFIGKTIENRTGESKVGRISALDPAGPLFEIPRKVDDSDRLSSTDADLVEVYHTNKRFLGFSSPIGSQDFYINNGGPIQPSCKNVITSNPIVCSHMFVLEFFTKSIMNSGYFSRRCRYSIVGYNPIFCSRNEVIIMGQHNNGTDKSGVFFGKTNRSGDPVAST